jgi:hypothetical protein
MHFIYFIMYLKNIEILYLFIFYENYTNYSLNIDYLFFYSKKKNVKINFGTGKRNITIYLPLTVLLI